MHFVTQSSKILQKKKKILQKKKNSSVVQFLVSIVKKVPTIYSEALLQNTFSKDCFQFNKFIKMLK